MHRIFPHTLHGTVGRYTAACHNRHTALSVASPAALSGAIGYNVYAAAGDGPLTLQNSSTLSLGVNWTESTSGFTVTGVGPAVNGVGDGNLTTARTFADDSTHCDTQYQYDWQNRQTDARGPDGMASHSEYDNLGEMTLGQRYADVDSDFVIDAGELRGQSTSRFDELGRVYSSTVYLVDPATGDLGHSLTSQVWYDPRGMQVKAADANGLFAKTAYDGLQAGAGRDRAKNMRISPPQTFTAAQNNGCRRVSKALGWVGVVGALC